MEMGVPRRHNPEAVYWDLFVVDGSTGQLEVCYSAARVSTGQLEVCYSAARVSTGQLEVRGTLNYTITHSLATQHRGQLEVAWL